MVPEQLQLLCTIGSAVWNKFTFHRHFENAAWGKAGKLLKFWAASCYI